MTCVPQKRYDLRWHVDCLRFKFGWCTLTRRAQATPKFIGYEAGLVHSLNSVTIAPIFPFFSRPRGLLSMGSSQNFHWRLSYAYFLFSPSASA